MLKKLFTILALAFLVFSCEKPHPDNYMSISGKFENVTEKDTSLVISGFAVRKFIKVNPDGTFKDSLKITNPQFHAVMLGGMRAYLHLENGYDIKMTGDRNNFFKSFVFEGNSEAAQSNQVVVDQFILGQRSGSFKGFMLLDKQPFLDKVERYKKGMDSILKLYPKADKKVVENLKGQNERFFKTLLDNYDKMHDNIVAREKALAKLQTGKPAPAFVDFENYKGGKNSLSDFKGKYVYIDVWATWCQPCIAQLPFLKKLEERYKGKNIEFVSVSTDDVNKTAKTWKGVRSKWRKMVKEKQMTGVQLWAGENNTLDQDYLITGIPRFILIDPEGKLIEYNSKRPFDERLIQQLDTLLVK